MHMMIATGDPSKDLNEFCSDCKFNHNCQYDRNIAISNNLGTAVLKCYRYKEEKPKLSVWSQM